MSLTSKLDQIRAGAVDRIPAEALKTMHRATEALRSSGILSGVLSTGPAPAFALANTAGERVSSAELISRGPLVITFYRGVW